MKGSPGRLYEVPILLASLLVGLSLAVGGYQKRGWSGAILHFVVGAGVIPGILLLLVGLGFLLGKLEELWARRRG